MKAEVSSRLYTHVYTCTHVPATHKHAHTDTYRKAHITEQWPFINSVHNKKTEESFVFH